MPTDLRVDLGIVIAHVDLGVGQHDKLGKIDPILGTGHGADWEEESGTTDPAPDIAITICKDTGARLIGQDRRKWEWSTWFKKDIYFEDELNGTQVDTSKLDEVSEKTKHFL